MQQQERFVRWEPMSGFPRNLDTPVLTDHYERGLQLTLAEPSESGRAFEVHFENPLAFRASNESYRLKLIESLTDLPWPTFKVENSEWLEWFHDQTLGIYRDWPVQHFLFLGEEVIDVLSVLEPRIAEVARIASFGWK